MRKRPLKMINISTGEEADFDGLPTKSITFVPVDVLTLVAKIHYY